MKKNQIFRISFGVAVVFLTCSFSIFQIAKNDPPTPNSKTMKVPDWAKKATIYELNIRQLSKQGTIAKATEYLPKIKALGVDIVWVMPIYPLCETNKKCNPETKTECLGSHYAAYDFKAVNPKYGSSQDFKNFVTKAHGLGLKVILDFVPDHTGWDSKWMKEHPEYFTKINGKMTTPIDPVSKNPTDWTDVAMLDYGNKELRAAITDAHVYWIKEFDVDGYREDVAGYVPDDYWGELRTALDKVKPVFMLAEWEDIPDHLNSCFQMNYGWKFHALIKDIAKGKENANSIENYLSQHKTKFPKQGYQMMFTQNHDENSWNGTERESFGDAGNTFTALCFTLDGMGLILSGQEMSLDKRLSFFHKDEIDTKGKSRTAFFNSLTTLKHNNKAIWNGADGGDVERIATADNNSNIFAFSRKKSGNKVVCVYNLSKETIKTSLKGKDFAGTYKNVMSGNVTYNLKADQALTLKPWEYLVLSNQ